MKKNFKITILVIALIFSMISASFADEAAAPAAAAPAAAAPAAAAPAAKPAPPKKFVLGDVVTDFKLPDGLTKAEVSFDRDIKGKAKVTAFTFMTTACSSCKAELSLLSDLQNKYGDDFKTYAIVVDINGESTVPAYDKRFGFNVRYLLDPEFSIPQRFGFTYTPSLVILDSASKIVYLKGGYSPTEDPDAVIQAVKDALK